MYFVRHAEAEHNIKEREAVQAAIARGVSCKEEQEKARRAVLTDEKLKDARLSFQGKQQVREKRSSLCVLNKAGFAKYPAPKIVLVSPLRRALMTATELFLNSSPRPQFVAVEALREKRTGFAADERSSVEVLQEEFPHVDFTDLLRRGDDHVPIGEDNPKVRARGRAFLEGDFTKVHEDSVALVTHKGWQRELRGTLKDMVDDSKLKVDFDINKWDQTLYKNAEIRVAQFGWDNNRLASIVSKSVDGAIRSVVTEACAPLIQRLLLNLSSKMQPNAAKRALEGAQHSSQIRPCRSGRI